LEPDGTRGAHTQFICIPKGDCDGDILQRARPTVAAGYGRATHERAGGIGQLCDCGDGPEVDFDPWRQFTIEHLIGEGQGGYPRRIRAAVDSRFVQLAQDERWALAARIHEANIVTACQFCNSVTSRDGAPFTMEEAIADLSLDRDEVRVTVARLGVRWLHAKQWITSPDPAYARRQGNATA
jgi:hypothetical protein